MTTPTHQADETGKRIELLPCPFCGKQPMLTCTSDVTDGYQIGYTVRCQGQCRIELNDEYESSVIEAWNTRLALASASKPVGDEPLQSRVQPWMMACFGPEISSDRTERNHRFLEEALELVQSTGCTQSEAHQLVDYVFGRPVGETHQEIGGVMITLAALCLAIGEDMHAAGETELARVWTKVDKIRAKQAAKPKHSPLPEALSRPAAPAPEVNPETPQPSTSEPPSQTSEQQGIGPGEARHHPGPCASPVPAAPAPEVEANDVASPCFLRSTALVDELVKAVRWNAKAHEERLRNELVRRLADLRRGVPEGWETIETAPKDGTPLLLRARAKHATAEVTLVGWFLPGDPRGWVEASFNTPVGVVPSAWRPLPAPPSATAQQDGAAR